MAGTFDLKVPFKAIIHNHFKNKFFKGLKVLTSFVFHLWRCVGKWSDLGNDSKLSGNLSGSPSVK